MNEQVKVKKSLQKIFPSAHGFFADTDLRECSVMVSIDDFIGEPREKLFSDDVFFSVVDYNDIYPYKYVFAYQLMRS
jgi:hypothetical protein